MGEVFDLKLHTDILTQTHKKWKQALEGLWSEQKKGLKESIVSTKFYMGLYNTTAYFIKISFIYSDNN